MSEEQEKRGPKIGWEVTPEIIDQIKNMAGLMTQEQMYNFFGVGKTTWYERKAASPEMATAIKSHESRKIMMVASKLMDEIMAGNVTAMIFYLKTKGRWAEYSKVQMTEKERPELPKTLGTDSIEAAKIYQKIMSEA